MSNEDNRFSARAARYMKVGTNVGGIAAKVASQRLFGLEGDQSKQAAELAAALGGLKGPLMKVAQLLSTIPEALPPEYARELSQLQSQAPPMGPAFVRRRMTAELGPDWRERFATFEEASTASASLGQVHRATDRDGRALAVKLQYPDMQSAVEADLNQLKVVFALHARMDPGVHTAEILKEIAARLREELDYELEAGHARLYRYIFNSPPPPRGEGSGVGGPREEAVGGSPNLSGSDSPPPYPSPTRGEGTRTPSIRVPEIIGDLSSKRLLTMTWLDGVKLLEHKNDPMEDRNVIARAMFKAWWYPFSHYGVIHGDPHLGNYTVFSENGAPAGINLLDYGCIRTFPVPFVRGVLDLYNGLLTNNEEQVAHAYDTWGFKGLTKELMDAMNIWARFIYGPLLEDRERTIADQTNPGEYGRREAFAVHKILKEKGPVTVPREFVFMDRAAIGLGGVFLHLGAKQNWYRLFNETIADFNLEDVQARQREAFAASGVPLPG
jgi:predicted unusual protein kinase regulating ubiquinone biosynthesis (AarF/ABC1/UbiB family)